ncbi:HIT family protein [Sphingomonas sp. LY54]|uniref:HIT family protein n=1 Tax=Sphingomonas sp. LY54 TaxID=3095343 RepID=UPI002D7933BB|nr:HIT family protein [Sphingomonas sp. LY54]WRP27788.1 HIT family protein [Sphingomonas sp. LY54]
MNATIERFGYPATLVADYEHWVVLLRPAQPTLGSLILAAKGDYLAFSDLPPAAFEQMHEVVGAIEATLAKAVGYQKVNYLMLMMVDPHVHYHVIPRYDGERSHGPITIGDPGWPKLPELGHAMTLDEPQVALLTGWLKELWPA